MPSQSEPMPLLRCRMCKQSGVRAVFTETQGGQDYTSYHCSGCDLFQTLGEIAPVSPDYIDLEAEDLNAEHRFLQTAHKLPAFRQWHALVQRHLGRDIRHARLLDIGCGVGGFLDFAQSCGAKTYGFDASKAHAEAARIRHAEVRHATSVSEYFISLGESVPLDLVTLWDVFEHIREPDALLAEIRQQLMPNKGLAFVSVPSGALNPTKVRLASMRGKSIGLIPWEHVFYYTTKSLRTVIERAGMEVIALAGVDPYVRQPLTMHELTRRVAHHALKHTPYAFQLYALARPV